MSGNFDNAIEGQRHKCYYLANLKGLASIVSDMLWIAVRSLNGRAVASLCFATLETCFLSLSCKDMWQILSLKFAMPPSAHPRRADFSSLIRIH